MRTNGRAILTALGLAAWSGLSASAAPGDSVRLKSRMVYDPAQITDVANGFVRFQFPPGGRSLVKPLAEVASITIAANAEYNRGETLLGEGKHADAVLAFQAAERAARKGWERSLIGYRLLAAADAAGEIEEAVKRWLKIVDDTGAGPGGLALRPTRLAPARSRANDRAIALLVAKAPQVKSKDYQQEIYRLLRELYTRQGQLEKARAVAAKLTGGQPTTAATTTRSAGGQDTPDRPPQGGGSNADQLRLAELSLKSRRYGEVLKLLRPRLKRFSAVELPTGLYLMGTAQLEMARLEMAKAEHDAAKARQLLLASGLNLMRVAGFFPRTDEAPRALLSAGEVNERLNNPEAARAAYVRLLKQHGRSGLVKQAEERLARLEKKLR